jgi:hypothetical protein
MRKVTLKLIQKLFLTVNTDIRAGDLVCRRDNEDTMFEAQGIFWDYNLKPKLFVMDNNGYIFSGNIEEFKRKNPSLESLTFLA